MKKSPQPNHDTKTAFGNAGGRGKHPTSNSKIFSDDHWPLPQPHEKSGVTELPSQVSTNSEQQVRRTPEKPISGPVTPKPKPVGDAVDQMFDGLDTDGYWAVAKEHGLPVEEMKQKLAHLNPGLLRMNIRNRVRKILKDKDK